MMKIEKISINNFDFDRNSSDKTSLTKQSANRLIEENSYE